MGISQMLKVCSWSHGLGVTHDQPPLSTTVGHSKETAFHSDHYRQVPL